MDEVQQYLLLTLNYVANYIMMNEKDIRILLQDIKTVYAVGTRMGNIETASEKKAQIEILEWILE